MRKLICTAVVLMGAHLGLTACGPVPYETSPHPVEVATTAESAGQHLDAARIWAVENDPFLQGVLAEIREIKKNATVVSAKEFMDTVFPGQHSVAIEELAAEQAVDRIQDLSVTHITRRPSRIARRGAGHVFERSARGISKNLWGRCNCDREGKARGV